MRIDNIEFNNLLEILEEMRSQLLTKCLPYLNDIKDDDIGNNVMITCPYHKNGQERRPSAGVRKSDGLFHCFTCGEIHSLPEVISFCFTGKDDGGMFGWNWLLRNFATVSIQERKDIQVDLVRRKVKNAPKYVSDEELDSYRYFHPYMYERGLTDPIIELFDIGYDKKTECITFPIRDIEGHTLFIARRSVNTKYFNYPRGVEKPIYGIYELRASGYYASTINANREIIVCESMLDALSFWVVGKYAVALNGLGSEKQFDQLRRLPCRKIILATDNDEAGMNARKELRKQIGNTHLVTEYLFPNSRKDANDCTKEELLHLTEVF